MLQYELHRTIKSSNKNRWLKRNKHTNILHYLSHCCKLTFNCVKEILQKPRLCELSGYKPVLVVWVK